ncbi:MAG: hypothetical protein IPF99_30315 [Deltaproteobacteria bacterium]|nr:hypothetical protein [Deltaproteobacteria bacterium]
MAPQSATLDSTAWLNSYPAALRAEGVHWLTVGVYGGLCAIGAIAPEAGVVLLAVFALVASLRVLLRNGPLLAVMAAAAVVGTFFPPLGVVLAVVAIFLLVRRIAFVFENIHVIGLGLVVYGVAIGAMAASEEIARTVLEWTTVPALQDADTRHLLAALGTGALTSALMHDVLVKTYKRGYSTEKALEIMSMIPLLLLSLVLPLLKLHFNVEVPAEPGFAGFNGLHHGPADFHGYGAVGEAVPEAMAVGEAAGIGGFVHGSHAAAPPMGFHPAPHNGLHVEGGHLGAPEPFAAHWEGAAVAHHHPIGFPSPPHVPETHFQPMEPMHMGASIHPPLEPMHPLAASATPHPFAPTAPPLVGHQQDFVPMMTPPRPRHRPPPRSQHIVPHGARRTAPMELHPLDCRAGSREPGARHPRQLQSRPRR